MDDGVSQGSEDLLYEPPVAPNAIALNDEGIMVDSEFSVKKDKYEIEMAAYLKGRKLRTYKRKNGQGLCIKRYCCNVWTCCFFSGREEGCYHAA